MKIWVLFHGEMSPDYPEYYECLRLQEEAKKMGHDLDILSPEDFDLVIDATDEWRAIYKGEHIDTPDLIIPRTGAETDYVGFSILRFYESLQVPMINSSMTIETVADKIQTGQRLAAKGFPIPRTILGKFPVDVPLIEEKLGFPLVIKTLRGTRGGGVFLSKTKEQFKDVTDLLAGANPNIHFLFQEYISKSHGRDLRVFVAGKKVVACMERKAADGNFKSNISLGGSGAPYPVDNEISTLALGVAQTLGLDMAGIDLLFNEGNYEVCEANSSPGFKGLETYCNVNVAEEVLKIGLEKVKARNSLWNRILHPRMVANGQR
ncbi:MAG: ribosomal protein modification protein [Micavibrio sp.]|nr:ribosomal protein modification protein [Micavibrio sp.]